MSVYTLAEPESLKDNIWILLKTRRGSFWQRPSLGSDLHELQNAPAIDRTAVRAVAMAKKALAILVAQGRASNISATAAIVDQSRLQLDIVVIDSARLPVELSTFIPVGVIS